MEGQCHQDYHLLQAAGVFWLIKSIFIVNINTTPAAEIFIIKKTFFNYKNVSVSSGQMFLLKSFGIMVVYSYLFRCSRIFPSVTCCKLHYNVLVTQVWKSLVRGIRPLYSRSSTYLLCVFTGDYFWNYSERASWSGNIGSCWTDTV